MKKKLLSMLLAMLTVLDMCSGCAKEGKRI